MPFTYPMSYRHSAVAPRYDMVKVDFPSGYKLFGSCRHTTTGSMNGAWCRSCNLPARFNWIDPSKLWDVVSCSYCKEPIIHFDGLPWVTLTLVYNQWVVSAPDITHDGDRGCWYLTRPLHYGCLEAGEPAFQVVENESTQHSHHDVEKEPDRNYYPEVADLMGRPEMELAPDDEQLEILLAEQKELDRYNKLCGPITLQFMPPLVKCGNCHEKHASKYMVMS